MNITNRIFHLTFLFLSLASCKKENNSQPEIELITKEVYYAETKNNFRYKHSYEKSTQRIKSTNLVTFKISNPTAKKVLLNLGEFLWHPMDGKIQKSKSPGMFFIIKDSVSTATMSTRFINYTNDAFNETAEEIFSYNDSIKKLKYELMGVYSSGFPLENLETIDNVIKNSVILYPHETRTFHFLLKLPLVQEINLDVGDYDPYYISEIENFDTFQLYYSADASHIKSVLPSYFLKELEENQVEIYDGILLSNQIPLLKR